MAHPNFPSPCFARGGEKLGEVKKQASPVEAGTIGLKKAIKSGQNTLKYSINQNYLKRL